MQTECPFCGEDQRPSRQGADIQSPFSLIASLPKREVHVGQAFFLNLRHTAPTEAPTLRKPGFLVLLSSPRVVPALSSAGSNAAGSPNGKHLITNQIHFISTTQIPSPWN